MKKLVFVYLKILLLSFVGVLAVKIWAIFVSVWMQGACYHWNWVDAKYILVNGSLLAIVFCVFATISYIKNRR
jgi:hypothetical protein